MKTKAVFFIAFIALSCFVAAQPLYPAAKKNKPLAILLSVVSPGMGQIYEGRPESGLAIWTAASILSFSFFMTIGEIDLYSVWYPSVNFRLKPAPTTEEIFWAAGIGATYALLYIYNIIDAAVYEDKPVTVEVSGKKFCVCYNLRF